MLITNFLAGCFNCTDDIPQRYDSADCKPTVRLWGNEYFVLVKCGLTFTDILDETEWQTHITNGDVLLSPKFGNFNIATASTNVLTTTGTGRAILDTSEYAFEYTTINTDLERDDEDWMQALYEQFNSYTIIPADINGGLAFNKEITDALKASLGGGGGAVAGTDIGFALSLTNVPQFVSVNGSGFGGQWVVNGYFRETSVLRYVEIPNLEAVFAANA